jgi:hypothetical protein
MKKLYSLYLTLILVIAVSLIIFSRVICDDDDAIFEIACNTNDFSRYEELLVNILSQRGTFYDHHNDTISPQLIISYLARQEKSPPLIIPTVIL